MWTDDDSKAARMLGWDLIDVYDGKRWSVMPLPTGAFPKSHPHAQALMNLIIGSARGGDRLCANALRHISQMNAKR